MPILSTLLQKGLTRSASCVIVGATKEKKKGGG